MTTNETLKTSQRKDESFYTNQSPEVVLSYIAKRIYELDGLKRNLNRLKFEDVSYYTSDFYFKATGKSCYLEKKEDALPFLNEAKDAYFARYLKVLER